MNKDKIRFLIMTGMAMVLLAAVLPSLASAAPSDLPPRPTPTTPEPTAEPPAQPTIDGGQIVLQVVFGENWSSTGLEWQDLWTVVQWQDPWGNWHDVSGWQGTLDKVCKSADQVKGMKSWWVPQSFFGKGAFRWLVYTAVDGDLLEQTESFELPVRVGQDVLLELELAS